MIVSSVDCIRILLYIKDDSNAKRKVYGRLSSIYTDYCFFTRGFCMFTEYNDRCIIIKNLIKMNEIELKIEDLEIAYRKLKSYYYYDNFSSFIRVRIAEFESNGDISKKLKKLLKILNSKNVNKLNRFLSKLNVIEIPKSYTENYKRSNRQILSNLKSNIPFKLKDTNYVIDAPIEIHIISVLWILKEGFVLQKDFERFNYGYILSLDNKGFVNQGLKLYEKYFDNYQKWRDNSIETAKSLLEKNQDVTIVQLDIKKYFHNISLDFNILKKAIDKNQNQLTNILELIHKEYYKLFKLKTSNIKDNKFPKKSNEMVPLPIGLLSSGVLGNWHLSNFDKKVSKKLSPAFYGRYVDDIIIVLANTQIDRTEEGEDADIDKFINEYFVKRELFKPKDDKAYELDFEQNNNLKTENLYIQEKKLSILEFNHKESLAALNNFVKKLKETSSIFWMLPEDEKDSQDFDKNANDLIYSDSVNKLRSLNNILPSKFGTSVFFSKTNFK